ncbi:MAG: hypothetical protein Q9163_001461 [Psora crenata]
MDVIRQALAGPPRRRQAGTTEASAAATSPASASAETTSASTAAASTPDETSVAPESSSITSSASLSAAATYQTPNGATTVFSIENPPQFTATKTTAYTAHGVNATTKSTDTPSGSRFSTTSTSSTTTYVDPAAAAAASATAFGVPKNQLTACQINGTEADNGPFCSPIQLQDMWVGYTYAITWNPALFAANATSHVQLRYVDSTLGDAWTSDPTPNYQGYVDIEMSKEWLKGAAGNDSTSGQNMTLSMISEPMGGENITKPGPQISLVVDPATLPPVPIKKLPSKYGLEIGAPIGLAALVVIVVSIWCGIRRNNRHHRSIRGISKDYMAKRARKRGKGGDIALEDYGSQPSLQSQFTDQPLKGGNAFRDEIARQRQEDDRSLRRFPTSY